jgi:trigger factor
LEYEVAHDDEIKKEIDISVSSTELDRFIEEEANKIQKDLALKGFRKGKVPKNIIISRYKDTLKAQAMSHLVNDSFLKIIQEKKWRPASQAELVDIKEGDTINFKLRFEIVPEFDVDNYLSVELFKEQPLPDDFLLEQTLNDVRERHSTIEEVSRPAVVDDFVTADLEIIENNTVKSKQNDLVIQIGNRSLPDEVNKALVGIKKSEKKEIKTEKQIYKITVNKIEEKILPQADDNFAKNQNYENIGQMKKKLLENAKYMDDKRIEENLKESLSKIILERVKFKVPTTLTDNEYKNILQRLNTTDSDANKERFWNTAEKRARLNLILDKIADKENIQVPEDEAMKVISAMRIKLNNENRQNVINYINDTLKREKTIDFLFKNAKISSKSRIISPGTPEHTSGFTNLTAPGSPDQKRMHGGPDKTGAGFTKGGN